MQLFPYTAITKGSNGSTEFSVQYVLNFYTQSNTEAFYSSRANT